MTNTSAIRLPLTLANALVAANPFEVEAALILAREALSRFVKEMELHEYAEQHAARN